MQNPAEFIGQVLCDRYQIEKQLGQKTGRRTFLAIDLQTELPVVIKLLIFNNEFIWDDLKLFEREAETLKHLDLPAIPRYLDYFEFDLPKLKGFALVQTYIDAPSLEEVVSSGRRFTESDLQEFATSVLDILDYLHSLQPPVIHRDLKPSNILLANRSGNSVGEVYLVDFGSVQNVAAKDGGTMTVVGTYGYMPMEQFGGKTVPASDLYSLGALVPSIPFIYNFLYYYLGKLHLKIDGDKISFQKTLFNLKLGKEIPASPRSKIDRLTYNIYDRVSSKKKAPSLTRAIIVRAGVREYRIHSKSEAECEWLLAELSEYLDLPVNR